MSLYSPCIIISDDGLSMNEIDLKLTNYNVIASRLGLTERRPIPDPMPFPSADPLGATTLGSNVCDAAESSSGMSNHFCKKVLNIATTTRNKMKVTSSSSVPEPPLSHEMSQLGWTKSLSLALNFMCVGLFVSATLL